MTTKKTTRVDRPGGRAEVALTPGGRIHYALADGDNLTAEETTLIRDFRDATTPASRRRGLTGYYVDTFDGRLHPASGYATKVRDVIVAVLSGDETPAKSFLAELDRPRPPVEPVAYTCTRCRKPIRVKAGHYLLTSWRVVCRRCAAGVNPAEWRWGVPHTHRGVTKALTVRAGLPRTWTATLLHVAAGGTRTRTVYLLECRCDQCGRVNTHGGGSDPNLLGDFLGGRVPHCQCQRDGREYELVDPNGVVQAFQAALSTNTQLEGARP